MPMRSVEGGIARNPANEFGDPIANSFYWFIKMRSSGRALQKFIFSLLGVAISEFVFEADRFGSAVVGEQKLIHALQH
jgi:hypothetical protein